MTTRQQANRAKARREINPERDRLIPAWAHPVVQYYFDEWRLIRDCIEGEKDVKAAGPIYLPKLDNQDSMEYDSYVERACYYNFTGRTLGALVGTLFRRRPQVKNLPAALKTRLEKISKSGAPFETLAETTAEEYLALGRVGVLVDLPATNSTSPQPYLVPYVAENIIDWDHEVVDPATGRQVLSYVMLREWVRGPDPVMHQFRWFTRYRKLVLEGTGKDAEGNWTGPRTYVQYTFQKTGADAVPTDGSGVRTVPMIRGEPLNYIPFHIFEAPRPPMLDIARLNISHYRSYAHLEHGRYFTGLPVYVATVTEASKTDFYVGPSTVWLIPPGGDAKILEFNGNGLKALENACQTKEAQASALGGRMIGVTAQSTAETDNQTAEKGRNEQATLHRAARLLEWGWTQLLRWWADFANETADDIVAKFNKDFLYGDIGSREFRAIQSMYKDGVIPIEVVYEYLVKAGVIEDDLELDVLVEMLENEDSFPNQPDFAARTEGYPNAQSKVTAELKEEELELKERELDDASDEAEAQRTEAEKARKSAANVDPGVAQQRQQIRGAPNTAPPAPGGSPGGIRRPPPRR